METGTNLETTIEHSIDHCFEIHDVTLREGDQHAGVAFSTDEKIEIAKRLIEIGISSIQAGFPSLSPIEAEAVSALVNSGLKGDFHCLCRYDLRDIDLADTCGIRKIGFSIPGSTSLSGNAGKLARQKLDYFVKYAKDKGLFLRMSCEDVARSELSTVFTLYEIAENAGADMITFADTVGRVTPTMALHITKQIKERFTIPLAVHFHNDLGLATANTIASLEGGADQIQVSVGGLGERAGIASMEEVLMILHTIYRLQLPVDTTKLYEVFALVRDYAGVDGADTKPIVGRDVFTHECGLHVEELLKNPLSYHPFDPCLVGRKFEFRFGKHSTPETISYTANQNGIDLSPMTRDAILSTVQLLALNKVDFPNSLLVQMAEALQKIEKDYINEGVQ